MGWWCDAVLRTDRGGSRGEDLLAAGDASLGSGACGVCTTVGLGYVVAERFSSQVVFAGSEFVGPSSPCSSFLAARILSMTAADVLCVGYNSDSSLGITVYELRAVPGPLQGLIAIRSGMHIAEVAATRMPPRQVAALASLFNQLCW